MKFNHMVNLNGVYYRAGEEVPMDVKAEAKLPDAPADTNTAHVVEEVKTEEETTPKRRGGRPRKG